MLPPFGVSGRLWAFDVPGPANWIGVLAPAAGPIALKPFATTLTMETTITAKACPRGCRTADPRGTDRDPGRPVAVAVAAILITR
ncbi:hypothetical protein ACF1FX_31935 [Streptomyces sp. NPDC014646]|uniref:hypothetical protein n=1 Tax=unclassified Streptomyces TaxID=2593676 RepID=UPI0036FC5784